MSMSRLMIALSLIFLAVGAGFVLPQSKSDIQDKGLKVDQFEHTYVVYVEGLEDKIGCALVSVDSDLCDLKNDDLRQKTIEDVLNTFISQYPEELKGDAEELQSHMIIQELEE